MKEQKTVKQSTVNAMIEVLQSLNQNNLEIIKIKAECSEF